MKINITKKQYESLAKIVYLGNWMANAQRTGSPEDLRLKEYEEISEFIFSLAPQFGLSEQYEYELEFSDSDDITEVSRLHEEYDEEMFFDELPHRLGERDFYQKYTEGEIVAMSDEERFTKRYDLVDVWGDELIEHGIDRLVIDKTKSNS